MNLVKGEFIPHYRRDFYWKWNNSFTTMDKFMSKVRIKCRGGNGILLSIYPICIISENTGKNKIFFFR